MILKKTSMVPKSLEGQRFDYVCVTLFKDHSRKFIKKVLDTGGAYLNKKRVNIAKKKVFANDLIELFWEEKETSKHLQLKKENILFICDDYVVIDKPCGIVSQSTMTSTGNTIIDALEKFDSKIFNKKKLFLVHRLDKDTSGIMIIARNIEYKKLIEEQFKNKTVHKSYEALCFGLVKNENFVVNYSISKHPNIKNHYFCNISATKESTNSKPAQTNFQLVQTFKSHQVSHLRCSPITGRTHQIRVHLSAHGFPILGDKKYSNNVVGHASNGLAQRHMLHASQIEFHNALGEKVKYTCSLPEDFAYLLKLFSKEKEVCMNYKYIDIPKEGSAIEFSNGQWSVPSTPIIPFIRGDGTGPEIWFASEMVLNAAVQKAYKGQRKIVWLEVPAGESSFKNNGEWLPDETIQVLKKYRVSIKGPLTTPVGKGIRSLNVALRQMLDLYQCIRPIRWYPNVPSPVKHPEKVDMVIFRENTEDIYKGIEYKANSQEQLKLINFFKNDLNVEISKDSGIGVKPISEFCSKRLARAAIEFAIKNKRKSVTFVHKGNIMKFTEGAFKDWAYEVGREEFGNFTVAWEDCAGNPPPDKILLKDIIADNMFQQALIRPEDFDVLATTNLNGDYLSDALAAQVGGLGIAPGANIGDGFAVFEATHGTAPKYAGLDKVNPGSVILSGVMLLDHIGWTEASLIVKSAFVETLRKKTVTYDFARYIENSTELSCSEFGKALISNM